MSRTGSGLAVYAVVQIYMPIVVLVLASVVLFCTYFKNYKPIFSGGGVTLGREVASLGGKFFIVQVAAIVLFQTDNIIISRILGPEEVVNYQVVNRYFSIFLMLFTILISPLWSGMTDAYRRSDRSWVIFTIKRLMYLHGGLVLVVILAFLASPLVINYWIGKSIVTDYYLSFGWACFVILQSWNLIFTHFLNGVGEVRVQIVTAIISIVINIPLSVYFATSLGMGSAGVIHATNISIFIYAITRYWRYKVFMEHDWYKEELRVAEVET
jgi:O-antigen/teichoic acid export membrane protein